jgi:cytochrome c-type biogenesis protein CcmH/NrfG
MRRDTFVFMLAGTVFGLVVGYMAAQWGVLPSPAPAVAASRVAPAAAAARPRVDPNETAALESLASRQPQDAAVRVELGNLYMDAERWDDAVRWYREALAIDPSRADVATDLGACLVSAGREAEALVALDQALARDPAHRLALYNRVVALLRLGRAQEAVAAWRELLKRHPDDPQAERLRARIDRIPAGAEARP